MANTELIQLANDSFPIMNTDSWKQLSAFEHSEAFAEIAPSFSKVLRQSSLVAISKEFELCDKEASRANRRYQVNVRTTIWSVFVVICSGALLLSLDTLANESAGILRIAIGFLALTAGALGSMSFYQLQQGHLFETWHSERNRAVRLRLDYFDEITTAKPDSPIEGKRLFRLMQFQYFRLSGLER